MNSQETKPTGSTRPSFETKCSSTTELEKNSSFLFKAWVYVNNSIRPNGLAEVQLILLTFCIGLQGMTLRGAQLTTWTVTTIANW